MSTAIIAGQTETVNAALEVLSCALHGDSKAVQAARQELGL